MSTEVYVAIAVGVVVAIVVWVGSEKWASIREKRIAARHYNHGLQIGIHIGRALAEAENARRTADQIQQAYAPAGVSIAGPTTTATAPAGHESGADGEWSTDCPSCHPGRRIAAPCGRVHDCHDCAVQRTLTALTDEMSPEGPSA
jgi:hypothetical protein